VLYTAPEETLSVPWAFCSNRAWSCIS